MGSSFPLPVCILAGGRATRLGSLAESRPKALAPVAGEPFAFHQLRLLARAGVREVVFCVGHLGDQVEATVGDGSALGVAVEYAHDPVELAGTAGAVRGALPLLGPRFLVTYGDAYLRMDYGGFTQRFLSGPHPAQMVVLRNANRWGRSNTHVWGERVVAHDKRRPDPSWEWIDFGVGAFDARVFAEGPGATRSDLSDVYGDLAAEGSLGAYETAERFYEIGTPEALRETERFLAGGGGPRDSAA